MTSVQLPWPYIPGADPVSSPEFQDRVQQNFDALSLALDQVVRNTIIPTAYTPAWTGTVTNPVIGNGTLAGRYARIGKLVAFTAEVIAGNTTTFGSGIYLLSLPVTAATGRRWVMSVDVLDTGTQHYTGFASVASGGSATEEIVIGSNSVGPTAWQNNSPFTFGNTDRCVISGLYEGA